ncbi:hypothetical protein ACFZBE_40445 [Streptomyces sp. NPDC008061]|uniref:hypothetical protein n=1 Tax=Streptomyces sp. NPDC008061 TaxID=3364805 RepID=UPI0036EA0A39
MEKIARPGRNGFRRADQQAGGDLINHAAMHCICGDIAQHGLPQGRRHTRPKRYRRLALHESPPSLGTGMHEY